MHLIRIKYAHIIVSLTINFFLYTFVSCSIQSMKKISDNGDYFVVLDSGLYIYNFEQSTQINITIFNEPIFETRDEYNQIIISKNEDDILNQTKIAALINYHLFIYTYDDSNNKLEHLLIEQLKKQWYSNYNYPFQVEIKNFSVIIYFISRYSIINPFKIQSLSFQNYLDIKNNEPKIDIYFEKKFILSPSFFCQIDKYDSSINCVYDDKYGNLYFLIINKNGDKYENQEELVYKYPYYYRFGSTTFNNITFTSNSDTIFVRANVIITNEIKCFYTKKSDLNFIEIKYNSYEKDCNPLTTYFNQETNEFVLSCQKLTTEYLYMFNGTDLNDIHCINVTSNINDKKSYLHTNNEITICDNLEGLFTNSYLVNNLIYDISEDEIFIPCEDSKIQFISTYNQIKSSNKNISIINLNKCEDELRYYYNISNGSDIYILKIEHEIKGMLIPNIEYEVYYLNNGTMEKLNLSLCNNEKIEILIPVDIKDDIDKHNPNSPYYNDICTKEKSDYGTDIILNDRKNEFVDKNMILCEDNCQFINYDNQNKMVKCSCDVKQFMSFVNDIKFDKNKLLKNFKDINYVTNIQVVKCYEIVFQLNNLKFNYGFYIFCFISLTLFICTFLFYGKFYSLLFQKINEIISALKYKIFQDKVNINNTHSKKGKNRYNKKIIEEEINSKSDKLKVLTKHNRKKNKKKSKTNKIKGKRLNFENELNLKTKNEESNKSEEKDKNFDKSENNNIFNKLDNEINLSQIENILKYNEYELNSLSYEDALKSDIRSFSQYYFSFLKNNNLLLFSFYPIKDYNSQIIKISLFFFFFSSHFTINALFFTDETMHKIYIDEGSFNLNYQIPQIIYSSFISDVIDALIKYLSLTEKDISSIKQLKNTKGFDSKIKDILHKIKIKLVFFFIVSFILLFCFWYYITCFCGIYVNTQIQLIKDTIISFIFTFIYPVFVCLVPALLRFCSSKSKKYKKELLYKLSELF